MATSIQIGAKLQLLIAATKLSKAEFVDQLVRQVGPPLRPATVEQWLADKRAPYKPTLEKLASFWRGRLPAFSSSHFLMPLDEFKAMLEARDVDTAEDGVVLPLTSAQLSHAQVSALAGAYRLFRYDAKDARIVSEALAISSKPQTDEPTLIAKLWSPTAKAAQEFHGAVIVMGDCVYLVLSDVDPTSSAMRFITLTDTIEPEGKPVLAMASGVFDKDEAVAAMTVAIERMSSDPQLAQEETNWVSFNASDTIETDIVIALQRPIS